MHKILSNSIWQFKGCVQRWQFGCPACCNELVQRLLPIWNGKGFSRASLQSRNWVDRAKKIFIEKSQVRNWILVGGVSIIINFNCLKIFSGSLRKYFYFHSLITKWKFLPKKLHNNSFYDLFIRFQIVRQLSRKFRSTNNNFEILTNK